MTWNGKTILLACHMRHRLILATLLLLIGCKSGPRVEYPPLANASNSPVVLAHAVALPKGESAVPNGEAALPNGEAALPNGEAEQEIGYSILDLVHLGLAQNPRLLESKHKIQSIRHRIPQELALPDPIFNTTTHLLPVETAAGRQAFALGINQKFVRSDRRSTKAAIAAEEVRAAQAEYARLQLELAEQIRIASIQLLEVEETIAVTQADLEALAQIEEVILGRYEVDSKVSQQDVLSIQIEQSNVENQLTQLQQKRRSFSARLARLIHFTPGSSFAIQDELHSVRPFGEVETWIARALHDRPELRAQLAQIRQDHHKICLASLQRKPDFTLGLNWIATSSNGISPVANGDDALLLGVGFNLPVNKERIRTAIGEARHASLSSSQALHAIQDQIAEEVFDTIAKLDSAQATQELLTTDIIPKSERTLELSIEEYANGKLDYTQLIANWRAVLRYRIAHIHLQSNHMQLMATLARQVGQLAPLQDSLVIPVTPIEEEAIAGVSTPAAAPNSFEVSELPHSHD